MSKRRKKKGFKRNPNLQIQLIERKKSGERKKIAAIRKHLDFEQINYELKRGNIVKLLEKYNMDELRRVLDVDYYEVGKILSSNGIKFSDFSPLTSEAALHVQHLFQTAYISKKNKINKTKNKRSKVVPTKIKRTWVTIVPGGQPRY